MGDLQQLAAAAAAVAACIAVLRYRKSRRPAIKGEPGGVTAKLLARGRRGILTRVLRNGGCFGIDIGGSLTKLAFFEPDLTLYPKLSEAFPASVASVHDVAAFVLSGNRYGATGFRDEHLSFDVPDIGGRFHFLRYETRRMDWAVQLARHHGLDRGMRTLFATGGGAIRFADAFRARLGIDAMALDEIDCLVKGMAFMMSIVRSEAFTFVGRRPVDRDMSGVSYPYLLVNIGSGVGFILVHSETRWERVSGTSLGGGTYYGLCHMLTGMTEFDEMLNEAERGNNANVDLTVGDIYGGDYSKFGLKASIIAASFGKAITWLPTTLAAEGSSGRSGSSSARSAAAEAEAAVAAAAAAAAATASEPSAVSARSRASSACSDAAPPLCVDTLVGPREAVRSRVDSASPVRHRSLSAAAGTGAGGVHASDDVVKPFWDRSTQRSFGQLPVGLDDEDEADGAGGDSGAGGGEKAPAVTDTGLTLTFDEMERVLGLSAAASLPGGEGGVDRAPSGGAAPAAPPPAAAAAPTAGGGVGGGATPHSPPSQHDPRPAPGTYYEGRDISRALLIMVSNNIGQLAYLIAQQYRCKHVYFAGNFLRHENTIAMRTLAYAITFWSRGTMEGLFLRHEGYCGAVGAFLSSLLGEDAADDEKEGV